LLQEIEFAGTIQKGFLVSEWPEDSRFDVYGQTWPAKTVGGDFYDFISTGPNQIGILIGDVSGKGVPAALAMAQLLAEFRATALQEPSPSGVVERMNQGFERRSRRGMFCTLCYISVDLETGKFTGANGGHHDPMTAADGAVSEIQGSAGPPLGILREFIWQDFEGTINPGQTLLLYTDGIVEARAGNGEGGQEEYGAGRLERCFARNADAHPRDFIHTIFHDVQEFCGPESPHDDCTFIALRYRG